MGQGFSLERRRFENLPGWGDDDPSSLVPALLRCRNHILTKKPYRTGDLGLTSEDLLPAMDAALAADISSASEARQFFEAHFVPFFIRRGDGESGFVTAFYEPDVEVSDQPDDIWRYPFYRRPDDLVDVDDRNRPETLAGSYVYGCLQGDGTITEYADRRAIDQGHLEGRGLEIAWARSKADVFFAHVQGAARLQFRDGTSRRITYAAKVGHPFSGIGGKLIEMGEVDRAAMSMGAIRDWLARHPDRADELYWHNRSYIFFREEEMGDPALGPIAAAKVQMTPGRSLAVDRLIHTFGCPFFIESESLTRLDCGAPFRRLMLALDTGSAILGPARGDIFTGSGTQAGDLAGAVRNEANFYILVPKAQAGRF